MSQTEHGAPERPESEPTPSPARRNLNLGVTTFAKATRAEQAIFVAAIATFIFAFLPWYASGPFTSAGTNHGGVLTLILALIGIAALVSYKGIGPLTFTKDAVFIAEAVCGGIVAILILTKVGDSFTAYGLWITLIAGLVWTAAAVASLVGYKPGQLT